MFTKKIQHLNNKINRIQKQLGEIGAMRPGTLTKQYRDREKKIAPFYQLSYTHEMRSRSELIRPNHLEIVKAEIAEYKKFKKLTAQWVSASIELSKFRLAELKQQKAKKASQK